MMPSDQSNSAQLVGELHEKRPDLIGRGCQCSYCTVAKEAAGLAHSVADIIGLAKDLAKLNVATGKSAAGFPSRESRGWARNDPARDW